VRFFFGNGQVFNTSGNDHKLALLQPDVAIPQPNQRSSLHDEEQFILSLVVMPDKLAFELASVTYESLSSPAILGLQYSSNKLNFWARFTFSMISLSIVYRLFQNPCCSGWIDKSSHHRGFVNPR